MEKKFILIVAVFVFFVALTSNVTAIPASSNFSVYTYPSNAGTTIPSGTISAIDGSKINISASPKSGFLFRSWQVSWSNAPNSACYEGFNAGLLSTSVTFYSGCSSVTAMFGPEVKVQPNNSTYGTTNPLGSFPGDSYSANQITATPKPGYKFVNWTSSPSGNCSVSTTTPTGDGGGGLVTATGPCTITANFSPTTYILQVSPYPAIGGTASGSASNISAGTVKSISATANSGYNFVNWSTTNSPACAFASLTSASTTVTVNGSCNVFANFSSASGGSCSLNCSSNGICNNNCATTSGCSADPDCGGYTLTVSAGSGGTVSGSATNVSLGSVKTITATPNSGYTFSIWSGVSTSDLCASSNYLSPSTTVTINGNCSVKANFYQTDSVSCNLLSQAIDEGNNRFAVKIPYSGFTGSGNIISEIKSKNDPYINGQFSNAFFVTKTAEEICGDSSAVFGRVTNLSGCGGVTNENCVSIFCDYADNLSGSKTIGNVAIRGDYIGSQNNVTGWAKCSGSAIVEFKKAVYNLTVSAGSGGTASGSASNISAGTVKSVSATSNSGYSVSNWTSSDNVKCPISNVSSDKKTASVTVNGDCTVTANFSPSNGSCALNCASNGICNNNCATTSGCTVDPDCVSSGYSLTVVSSDTSKGTVSGSVSNVLAGLNKSISATANSGYHFTGFVFTSGKENCYFYPSTYPGNPTAVTVNGNCTATAYFSSQKTLHQLEVQINDEISTYRSGAAGSTTSSVQGSPLFRIPVSVQLYQGYVFNNWSVASGGTNCVIENSTSPGYGYATVLDGVCTIYANVSKTGGSCSLNCSSNGICNNNCATASGCTVDPDCGSYTLTVDAGSGGTVSGSATNVSAGTVKSVSATPNSVYYVSNWTSSDNTKCSISNISADKKTASVTVNGNCTVTASFSQGVAGNRKPKRPHSVVAKVIG